jgi:anti-sigma factor RsiW
MKMDCRQIEELMMDYLYQELDADQMTAYRAHLPTCATCAAMLAGYERTRQAVRALPELEPPESVTSRLLAEAARRPVAAAATVGGVVANAPVEGKSAWAWLTGWMQPIFAHPGFAAAASVIIVAGIAGILTLRGNLDLTAAPQAAAPVTESAPAAEPEVAPANELRRDEATATNAPAAGYAAAPAAPPADLYAVKPGALQPTTDAKKAVGTVHLAKPQERPDVGEFGTIGAKDESADKRAEAAPEPKMEAPADAERGRVVAQKEAKAPSKATASKPSPPPKPARAMREDSSSLDDLGGVEGGVVGGESAGAVAAAPSAAPPPPPPAAPVATTTAGAGASPKGKSADSPQVAEAKKLHGQARSKANTGDCAEALRLRDRIYRVDPAYFERSVKNDADLGKCTVARKKAAPAPTTRAPAPAENSAPAADTKPAQ